MLGHENTLVLKFYIFSNRNHNPLLSVTSQLVTVGMLTVLQRIITPGEGKKNAGIDKL